MSVLFTASSSQYATFPNNALSQNRPGFTVFFAAAAPNSNPGAGTERRLMAITVNGSTTSSRVQMSQVGNVGGALLRAFSRRLDGDGGETADSSPGTFTSGNIYTCGAVYAWNSQSLKLWIDGAIAASAAPGSWTGNSSNTTPGGSTIAARPDAALFFDGRLEAMMMWPEALPDQVMRALHATRGALENAASLSVGPCAQIMMRGELPVAPSTFDDIWGALNSDATTVNSPTYDVNLARGPFGALAD